MEVTDDEIFLENSARYYDAVGCLQQNILHQVSNCNLRLWRWHAKRQAQQFVHGFQQVGGYKR